MKKALLIILTSFVVLISFTDSRACIDPDPTKTIVITVNYDTLEYAPYPWIFNVEMRFSNLRLMNETPNKFCSCALAYIPMSEIQYVAFVDSGTNDPYNGFSLFDSLQAASADWNATSSSSNWRGFVSDVINGGLMATSSVEMVLRYELSFDTIPSLRGYTVDGDSSSSSLRIQLDTLGALGTDEWNPTTQKLVNAHRGIRDFAEKMTFLLKPASYFQNLDNSILNNIPVDTNTTGIIANDRNTYEARVFPNPFSNNVDLHLKVQSESDIRILVYDYLGKQVFEQVFQDVNSGKHEFRLRELSTLNSGIYYLHVSDGTESKKLKLLKQ